MSPAGSDLVVLIPALSRPQNVAPVFSSIVATAPAARVLFLSDPGDEAQIEAVRRTDADLDLDGGNYAAKINRGIRLTGEPLIFTGADDLHFRDGWLDACRQRLDRAEVIGTQDLCNQRTMRGEHSTHFLVTRDYAERGQIDGEPGLLCEGYAHNCVDDELIATATARGVYAFSGPIEANRYGLFMLDIEQGTVWCYEFDKDDTGTRKLRLSAARSWVYDRYLKNFNCAGFSPAQIQELVAQERANLAAGAAEPKSAPPVGSSASQP